MVCGGLWWFACISLVSLPIVPNSGVLCGRLRWFVVVCGGFFLPVFLTRSHWFPLVGCGVPVGLNDGTMKPSLAYV